MNSFFIEAEAKIFYLLIIGFLWLFQSKSGQEQPSKQKSVYLFSFAGIVLSFIKGIPGLLCIQNVCDAILGLCYAFVTYFWCRYAFEMKKYKEAMPIKIIPFLAAASFGILAYFSFRHNINSVTYISVFAIIVVFAVNQYNKIRIDNLTKLYNRYGMDEEIREQLLQYARKKGDSFYIIACDLDNFKHINDTWGHLEGDRALILISSALSKVCKMFDAEVFRIGGDEFVIITDTSEDGLAADITSAIKNELDNIDFRDDFDIKMSIGSALYDGKTDVKELLDKADKKLYEAKKISKKAD